MPKKVFGGSTNLNFVVLIAFSLFLATATAALAAPRSADLSVRPGSAKPGEVVRISGTNFAPGRVVEISFRGELSARTTTDRFGRFTKNWRVPKEARSGYITAKVKTTRDATLLKVIPEPKPETTSPETTMPETTSPETTSPETTTPSEPENVERWSEAATWGEDGVPSDGESVIVPQGKTVLLDTDTASLEGLTVNGTLIFEERDVTLTSDYIMVHGRMEVGSEADPFSSRARIILTGSDASKDVMGMGTKILGVMGGTLEVHGEERDGWTRLSQTATKGQNRITLERNPGWRVGDRIAIASTDFDSNQAEEFTVRGVSGATLTLDRPLTYTHYGQTQTFGGKVVDERAEVSLLTRNITIEGEERSSANGFGGQIMAMSGGEIRMEGAELARMGQKNILRRYPVHFHTLGDDGRDSYLKDTTIRNSFNRCVTIHGTNNLRVSGNTCYDTLGHGFFMEDGAETDNIIDGNLAFKIRRPEDGQRLLASDRNPAAFWITNPDNTVTNNVAAGSEGFGFWFAFPKHPTGLSKNENVWPRRTPLGEVSGNTAHSNQDSGFFVDNGPTENGSDTETTNYRPLTDPTDGDSPTVKAVFTGINAYKNRHFGVWLRGYDHIVRNSVLADNAVGATFASDESYLVDSLIVGETQNPGNPGEWEKRNGYVGSDGRALPQPWRKSFPIRGFEFYDGKVGTSGSTFVNFQPTTVRQASAVGMRLENRFQLDPDNYLGQTTFVNSKKLYLQQPGEKMDGERSLVFVDGAGSLTGKPGSVVTSDSAFLARSNCEKNPDWNAYVCPPEIDHVSLGIGTQSGSPAAIKPLILTNEQGRIQTLDGCCDDSTLAFTNLVAGEMYDVSFNGQTPESERLVFILANGDDRDITLKVPYAGTPKVLRWGDRDMGPDGPSWAQGVQVKSVAELRAPTVKKSSYYHDAANDLLYIKIVAKNPTDNGEFIDWVDVQVVPK